MLPIFVMRASMQLAVRVMTPFLGGRIEPAAFAGIVEETFEGFMHSAVAPLKQLNPIFG